MLRSGGRRSRPRSRRREDPRSGSTRTAGSPPGRAARAAPSRGGRGRGAESGAGEAVPGGRGPGGAAGDAGGRTRDQPRRSPYAQGAKIQRGRMGAAGRLREDDGPGSLGRATTEREEAVMAVEP